MRYRDLREVPRRLPKAGVLVHNWVHAQWEDQRPGRNGFRVWMEPKRKTGRPLCQCGWSGLPHYRTTGLRIAGIPPVVTGKRCPAWMLDEDAELRCKHKAVRDAAAGESAGSDPRGAVAALRCRLRTSAVSLPTGTSVPPRRAAAGFDPAASYVPLR